jgi:hypothetical protein
MNPSIYNIWLICLFKIFFKFITFQIFDTTIVSYLSVLRQILSRIHKNFAVASHQTSQTNRHSFLQLRMFSSKEVDFVLYSRYVPLFKTKNPSRCVTVPGP